MEYRSSEIKAGIFIIASLLLLAGFLVVIVGVDAWAEKDEYRVRFKYVGGIEKGSIVRYSGIEVGRVVGIGLSGENDPRAELTLQLKKDTPIRQDSYAFLTTIGIMGAFYIEITAGSPDAPLVPVGEQITSKDVTAFAQMSESTSETSEHMTELLTNLNELLNEQNRTTITEILVAIKSSAQTADKKLDFTISNLNSLVSQMKELTVSLNTLVVNNDNSVSNILSSLEQTLVESKVMVANINNALQGMDVAVSQNSQSINEIVTNLEGVTRNLEQFSQDIKERPWNLVRKSAQPERKLK
jgi:phospholipid/cholesterol/gamma-HCH transport system substrate-binding protein